MDNTVGSARGAARADTSHTTYNPSAACRAGVAGGTTRWSALIYPKADMSYTACCMQGWGGRRALPVSLQVVVVPVVRERDEHLEPARAALVTQLHAGVHARRMSVSLYRTG
jgi:hypothetical protein